MRILGISAFYHDSAATLIEDGRVIAAAEEERFSRIKHDNDLPFRAVRFCLKEAGVGADEIDAVAYYEKPLRKFERILETFVATYPRSLGPFVRSIPEWLGRKIKIEHIVRKEIGFRGAVHFVPHHLSHAAAAFFPSPFDRAAILTVDGVGEYQTTGLWEGDGTSIRPIARIDFPHSLGLLYSTVTAFLGFRVNDDEYKVMGLAAYGKPALKEKLARTIRVMPDGGFALDLSYFAFRESFRMWSKKFEALFGAPRRSDGPITDRDRDLAASVQLLAEELYFSMLSHLQEATKLPNVCVGGGVALNALANGKIHAHTPFRNVYIFGPAGDSGAAIGAALYAHHALQPRAERIRLDYLSLGSHAAADEILAAAKKKSLAPKRFEKEEELLDRVTDRLSAGKVVGWFQGKMEFGPRALGNRSILSAPAPKEMKDTVNRVKGREMFRPFAGSVLEERAREYFEIPDGSSAFPFMNFCFPVRPEKRGALAAITHADFTCRIQTVNESNGLYHRLIQRFGQKTGVYCVLNTSFNLKGEPIVETPEHAIEDFLRTPMDCLAIGSFFLEKT